MSKKEVAGSQPVVYPVFRDEYNGAAFDDQYENNTGESLTVPDEAMTISELMSRFASGLPLDNIREPLYDGDEEGLTDIARLDLEERKQIVEEYKALKEKIDADVRARREEAEQRRLDELVDARIKEKEAKRSKIAQLQKELGESSGKEVSND